jgi:hypothetical protein
MTPPTPIPNDLAPSLRGAFPIIFAILTLSSMMSAAIGYYYSIDVRGWWPVLLYILANINFVYTLALVGIARLARRLTIRALACHAVALSAFQQAHTLAFYNIQPDWEAVNGGRAVLTPLQNFFHSDASFYGMYLAFLCAALAHGLTLRWTDRSL